MALEKLPEAKASVTYSIKSPKGFDLLFTMRSMDEGELLSLMEETEEFLVKEGYTAKGGTKPVEKSTDKECPKCGSPLVEIEAKGKPALRCSTNEWDPDTKTATGCDYFSYVGDAATPNQEKVLKDRGLWKDGMTKAEASVIIGNTLGK